RDKITSDQQFLYLTVIHRQFVGGKKYPPFERGNLMSTWQQIIENKLEAQRNKIAEISLERETVNYSEQIKHNRNLKVLTGDEEVIRAFLLDRLVNELDYKPENIETEKEYKIVGGHSKLNPRIDILVKDDS